MYNMSYWRWREFAYTAFAIKPVRQPSSYAHGSPTASDDPTSHKYTNYRQYLYSRKGFQMALYLVILP